jgi:glyoxylase-like metal-dependent hydrolase (beta-lactamase superfamily II)
VELYNVESGHTDEYLIVYFPRQKVLLTGDLLFYRPGKPLGDRSMKLCETVRKLGLDVETYVATWPLDGYGTKNVVTRAEIGAACE